MMWVRSRDKRTRHDLMTSHHCNCNNAIAVGVVIHDNVNCVSFIFVLTGIVEILQFNKLLIISFSFLDDIREKEYVSLAYSTKQGLFAEFVANISSEFSSILAYMVQVLGSHYRRP